MPAIHFLGAAGTVTGSRHLVEHAGRRVLLDCGLFQGDKPLRSRNWDPFPVPPGDIDAVVLSHAHIDHTGFLPRLVKDGFRGKVYCTPATRDLLAIMLPDSGRIQEEEAEYANRKRYSRHSPALPLYSEDDAVAALKHLRPVTYGDPFELGGGITLTFTHAGHILGSASVCLDLTGDGQPHRILFSGDLGRYDMPIVPDPAKPPPATTLLVECTYGDRDHAHENPRESLAKIVDEIVRARGALVIPAFAIGRTQDLLYHLRQLQLAGRVPSLPVFVDSPMACDATPLYLAHREEHDDDMRRQLREGRRPLEPHGLEFARSVGESRAINDVKGPCIILSASGMATGGRILHHLAKRLPDPNATILFVGYQAGGTRGRRLLNGEKTIRIHGQDVEVKARIRTVSGFSAHADRGEVDRWLAEMPAPKRSFCIHGEPSALEAARARLESRGWPAFVPTHGERVEL